MQFLKVIHPVAVSALMVMGCGFASASASNVYIAQIAAGSANGSSCANAYAVTFFNTAGNWGAGANQIGPGTTAHLCGTFTGSAGSTMLTFQGSGSSGNPVTLVFETGATLTAPYWGANVGSVYQAAINVSNKSYITINGANTGSVVSTANGSNLTYQNNSAGVYVSGGSDVTVENLAISNMFVHVKNSSPSGGNASNVSAGIQLIGSSNFTATGNTIHDAVNGMYMGYDSNRESNYRASDNVIYNCNWGIGGGDNNANSALSGLYVFGNSIHDWDNWTDANDNYHHNGVYFWAEQSGGSTITSAFIYNNVMYGAWGGSNCTAGIFMSQGSGNTIVGPYLFNNVIDQTSGACGNGVVSINASSVHLYNNTLIEGEIDGPNGPSTGTSVLYNNSYSSPSGAGEGIYDTTAGLIASDYNSVYNVGSYSMVLANKAYNSLPGWVSGTGFDAHSLSTNPNLNSSYQPNSGSPLAGAGTNLYAMCNGQPNPGIGALCYDVNGVPRSATGKWDIGAYAAASVVTLAAPTNPTAMVH